MIKISFMLFMCALMSLLMCHSPLQICLALIIMSLISSLILYLMVSKWLAYSLVLIFLGGMMIIFLYVSTIALDQKLVSPPTSLTVPFVLWAIFLSSTLNQPLSQKTNHEILLKTIYQLDNLPLLGFLIIYLLMTLITVVKFSQSFKGAVLKLW